MTETREALSVIQAALSHDRCGCPREARRGAPRDQGLAHAEDELQEKDERISEADTIASQVYTAIPEAQGFSQGLANMLAEDAERLPVTEAGLDKVTASVVAVRADELPSPELVAKMEHATSTAGRRCLLP